MEKFILKKSTFSDEKMDLSPKDIHIWSIDLIACSSDTRYLYGLLSYDEYKRASQYRFEKDKASFIMVRGILRKIIGFYLAVDPSTIEFFYNAYGKPYIANQNQSKVLYFNVSHSADLALCVFAMDREVGVDIEKIRSVNDYEHIAQKFFAPSEYLNLKAISEELRLSSFFKCWTRKEAFIKAIGNGLSYPLNQFEVSLIPNEPVILRTIKGNYEDATTWVLQAIDFFVGYEAAVAFKDDYDKIEYWQYV